VARAALQSFYWKPGNALARTVELRAYRSLSKPLAAPVLDLGCGEGGTARMLAALGLAEQPLCGLDLRFADLSRARRSCSHRHLVGADARHLPFADRQFATVVANGVLCCLPQGLDAALAEIRRILRPGGLVVATVPTRAFTEVLLPTRALGAVAPGLARLYADRVDRRLGHASVLAEQEWRRRFEGQGLVVEHRELYASSASGWLWSLLFSQPLRIFGLLRLPGLRRLGAPLATALFARTFARLHHRDATAGPPFGYVLIAARRPLVATEPGDAAC
jgi:SAM-dependent methyltransferase